MDRAWVGSDPKPAYSNELGASYLGCGLNGCIARDTQIYVIAKILSLTYKGDV